MTAPIEVPMRGVATQRLREFQAEAGRYQALHDLRKACGKARGVVRFENDDSVTYGYDKVLGRYTAHGVCVLAPPAP